MFLMKISEWFIFVDKQVDTFTERLFTAKIAKVSQRAQKVFYDAFCSSFYLFFVLFASFSWRASR